MKKPLFVLDAYALIYRSYYAFNSHPLRNQRGENVSAAYGFFRFLFTIWENYKPEAFVCAFDPKGKTFRHDLFPAYKANRQVTPEDLHNQIPLIEEILAALEIPRLVCDGYEADDVIATLAVQCEREDRPCYVISGDKDLLQLVRHRTKILKPTSSSTSSCAELDRDAVIKEWGIEPELILDYLALTGDSADNIPGVKGVGDKTAVKLMLEFKSLENIYANLATVKPDGLRKKLEADKENAFFSRQLASLVYDVPLTIKDISELEFPAPNYTAARELFLRENMKTLVKGGAVDTGADSSSQKISTAGGLPSLASAMESAKNKASVSSSAASATAPIAADTRQGLYKLITTENELEKIIAEIKSKKIFAFDCETTSLVARNAELVGFSLSYNSANAYYIPLHAPEADNLLSLDIVKKQLTQLFSDEELTLIGQNIKYDYAVMSAHGLIIKNKLFDTMIAAQLLDTEQASYNLEALAERYLGYHGISFDTLVTKGGSFADVELDQALIYASEDADLCYRLYEIQKEQLTQNELTQVFYDIEMPLLPILAQMEERGITVDPKQLSEFGKELELKIASTQQEIYKLCGKEFNIASPKQLQEILFIERKLPAGKKSKSGYSTDSSVLEELIDLDPVPALVLQLRGLSKLKSTYVDGLLAVVKKDEEDAARDMLFQEEKKANTTTDTRIHTHYLQCGAATGRLASKDPNLQNLPIRDEEGRRIRQAFTAEKNSLLISADYSQIELVVLAHLANDEGLKAAFIAGEDIHRRTASLLFGIAPNEVSSEQRRISKAINFGVIYGMSAFRLSRELKIARGDAQKFIDTYFASYQGITNFITSAVAFAEDNGYARTIMGRRRAISSIKSSNKMEKAGAERIAVNTVIQGSAADIIKIAMLRVDAALKRELPSAKLLLQVHDELIVEVPNKDAETAASIIKREMEAVITLNVPLRASVEIAHSWGDIH